MLRMQVDAVGENERGRAGSHGRWLCMGSDAGGAESRGGRRAGLGGRSGWEAGQGRGGDLRSGQVFRGEPGLRVCWNLALLT